MIKVRQPRTKKEFEAYYDLRWRVLREPWGLPRGSEKDELEDEAIHIIAVEETTSTVVGTGRLHKENDEIGHVRQMAVEERYRRKGIGSMILEELHSHARRLGLKKIVMDARDVALDFYRNAGYETMGEGFVLLGSIPHHKMEIRL